MKKRILCTLLALVLAVSLCVPALAADRDWESAYASAISSNTDKWGSVTKLVDLDLDGTPELLIGGYPGSGLFSQLNKAFTFRDGALKEVSLGDASYVDLALGDYTLWWNKLSGSYRITASLTARAGAGYYATYISEFALKNDVLTQTTLFLIDTAKDVKTYYVDGTKVSKSVYDQKLAAWEKGWEQVDGFFTGDLSKYGKPTSAEIQELFDSYPDGPVLAQPSAHKVTVDGVPVALSAYNIGGNNYFKLRDVAMVLTDTEARFQVGWDAASRMISLTTGESYTPVGGEMAAPGSLKALGRPNIAGICADGVMVSPKAYNINDNTYFKLRDLSEFLDFEVGWDEETKTVSITTANWDAKVGTTLASITADGEYTVWYGSGNLSARSGFDGECTWYAYGRFYELTDIQLGSARNAKYWLNDNRGDSRVVVTDQIQAPAIAVRTSGSYGHVMFVEHVEYNADGTPAYVYFTECNWDSNNSRYDPGEDCILLKMSYNEFLSKRMPTGYIVAAG